jgi:hypothetical protein
MSQRLTRTCAPCAARQQLAKPLRVSTLAFAIPSAPRGARGVVHCAALTWPPRPGRPWSRLCCSLPRPPPLERTSKSPSLTALTPKSTPMVGMYLLTNLPSQYLRAARRRGAWHGARAAVKAAGHTGAHPQHAFGLTAGRRRGPAPRLCARRRADSRPGTLDTPLDEAGLAGAAVAHGDDLDANHAGARQRRVARRRRARHGLRAAAASAVAPAGAAIGPHRPWRVRRCPEMDLAPPARRALALCSTHGFLLSLLLPLLPRLNSRAGPLPGDFDGRLPRSQQL